MADLASVSHVTSNTYDEERGRYILYIVMPPNNSQHHSGMPATNLPPISAQPQQTAPAAPVSPNLVPGSSSDAAAHYAAQARQAVVQYANDPYRLCEVLGQLKSAFLLEQYHITSNKTGN